MKIKQGLFEFCRTSYEEPGWIDVVKTGTVGLVAGSLWGTLIAGCYGAVAYWFGG